MSVAAPQIKTNDLPCNFCGAHEADVIARGVDFEYDSCSNEFTYVRCRACGHLYLNPLPDPSELGVIYPPHYGNFEHGRDTALTFRIKNRLDRHYLRKMTQGLRVERVLDIGCADGRMLALCRDALPGVQVLEGVEFSQTSGAEAIAKGFTVHIGSVDTMPLKDDCYDLVFLQQVIEHVYDPSALVARLYRAVRRGGRVCFEMPTSDAIDRAFGSTRYWGGYHFPRHFNIFSEKNFRALCERSGFSVVSVAYRFQPVHWVWTVHHWMKENGWPAWLYDRFNIKNPVLIGAGTVLEAVCKLISGKAANMQVVVEKRGDAPKPAGKAT